MKLEENIPLAEYTTFKIGGPARFFCRVADEKELMEAVRAAGEMKERFMILGGGSNLLVSDAGYSGVVIKNEIMGRQVVSENTGETVINVGAGESWDELVAFAVESGYGGLENLSAIPGTVGAAPVQNIGAYGAEVSEVVESVRVFDSKSMAFRELSKAECDFSYRDSVFKKEKGRYAVVSVRLRLRKNSSPNISYKDLKEHFPSDAKPSISEVREAVINIRWKKLPDWHMWGTAGSYFKNPVIVASVYENLKNKYPELPGFAQPDGQIKISAAWILDRICGVKGAMKGNVGSYENQALVLVAKTGATAAEVVAYAEKLMDCVKEATGVELEAEVEWVN